MNKSMITGLIAGAVLATTAGAIGGYRLLSPASSYAKVLEVTEATQQKRIPREVCEDVAVTRQQPVKDEHQVVGTVAGAVLGAVIGKQLGGGSGKKVATAAGAVAGGYAGNKTQEQMQANNTYTTSERRCRTVTDTQSEVIGYDVRYLLNDNEGLVRMDHRPGDSIPVVDGQLVLNSDASKSKPLSPDLPLSCFRHYSYALIHRIIVRWMRVKRACIVWSRVCLLGVQAAKSFCTGKKNHGFDHSSGYDSGILTFTRYPEPIFWLADLILFFSGTGKLPSG